MALHVGVLGLGAMGLPIAGRLRERWEVSGFDTDEARRALAAARGISVAPSAKDLAAAVDVLVAVLPGAAVERSALTAGTAVIEAMAAGTVLVEMTSGAPDLSRELAAIAGRRGVGFVSAPMAGDPAAAAAGTLGFFVSGTDADVERVRPLWETLARPDGVQVVSDDPGAAQTAKLIVNALWFSQAASIAEMMVLAVRSGLDPGRVQALLAGSAAGSAFIDDYLPRLLAGDYVDSFRVDGIIEELDTVLSMARAHRIPAGVLERARDLHLEAQTRFGGREGDGELIAVRLLEDQAGVRLRDPGPG